MLVSELFLFYLISYTVSVTVDWGNHLMLDKYSVLTKVWHCQQQLN